MARNGFFGVKNSHFAICTDEDALTYEDPVHVAGTVAISMEPTVETATSYADNEPWLDKQQDNGGSGTMSFYDTESTAELRQLYRLHCREFRAVSGNHSRVLRRGIHAAGNAHAPEQLRCRFTVFALRVHQRVGTSPDKVLRARADRVVVAVCYCREDSLNKPACRKMPENIRVGEAFHPLV